jgi:Domain of unknown function (DUF6265)
MKKNTIALFFLFAVSSFTEPFVDSIVNMKQFTWLQGSWQMQTRRGMIVEKWVAANDSSYAGESKMIRADGTEIPLEKIELIFRNGSYYYIPTVRNQNGEQAVEFKITSHSESGFVAENPQHDFPKRIRYTLVNNDSIHAVIDDGAATPVKKSDFYYSRKKQ